MKNLLFFFLLLFLWSCTTKTKAPEHQLYSIDQFYQNIRFSGGSFSNDESKLLVSCDETGIFNLYEIDLESGLKSPITNSADESYFAIGYVPETGEMLYSADKGGDELDHIYLIASDSTTVDLTPGEKEKASFAGWNKDRTAMYYVSNKRDPRFFDLYKMPVATWEAEMIYQNDAGMDVSAISFDEKTLALVKAITTSEVKLFLYDMETKAMKELSDVKGSYDASGFSLDDQFFYYITDADKEFKYLVEYEVATGNKKVLYETNWDVMYSYLSETGKYRVTGVNEDGKNVLRITDPATGEEVPLPPIPDGDVMAVRISKSEKLARLSIGTSKAPTNIYVYNFETDDLKKLTESLNPAINPDDLVAAEVVRFNSFDGLEIPAIYYKPQIASADNKVPALVWVHGGPGGQTRVGYFALIQYLVNHGYAVLAVNNRGSSGYGKTFYKMDDRNHGDKDLKDCIAGKDWLVSQDYIDSEKIGIIGGSYGGYMTMAAMAFTPDEFKVGVDIFGVTNWLRTLKSIPPYWESFRAALYEELGDPFTEDSVRLYNISPLFHAGRIKNPVMVLQGANDPRVLQVESDEIVEAIRGNNVPVEYVVFPDEGHGFVKKENEIKGYGQILTFLDQYLKGVPAAQ